MSRMFDVKALLTVLALLTGCGSVPSTESRVVGGASSERIEDDGPDPRPVAAWEQQLPVLSCNYQRHSLAIRSRDPLVFAINGACSGGELARAQPGLGYMALLVVDTGRSEVQSTRIRANGVGGLHYTASGDLMWFSTATRGTSQGDRRFIEVFVAPAGTVEERSLGQLAIPFYAYPPYVQFGEGCHVLQVSAFREKEEDPHRQMMWIFRDDDPIASATLVEGVGRILYWNPIGKYFVTQKQVRFDRGPLHSNALEYSGLTCSGETVPLTGKEAERLAEVTDIQAKYLSLPNGDLVVASKSENPRQDGAGELLVFRGDRADRIGPFSIPIPDCPDFSCAPIGFDVFLHGASATGRHFLAELSLADVFAVYRAEDLAKVRRWRTPKTSGRYVHVLVDDSTVMQMEDGGGPISYYEIPESR